MPEGKPEPESVEAPKPLRREHMYGCPCCFDAYVPVEDRFTCEPVDDEPSD